MKVYITAPFTSKINEDGVVEKSFVELVEQVDTTIKNYGLSTYITYRDFLRWGKVVFNPDTIFEKLRRELKSSDLLVAVHPNEGVGTNLVIGVAVSMKKPIIIILNNDFERNTLAGLMYQGLRQMTDLNLIIYSDFDDLKKKLRVALRNFQNGF